MTLMTGGFGRRRSEHGVHNYEPFPRHAARLQSPRGRFPRQRPFGNGRARPATRNLPERFTMGDEWYEFSESPRGRGGVRVLATADESTYRQNRPMGDHPLIWTNEAYRRAIYIAVGHDSLALANEAYSVL